MFALFNFSLNVLVQQNYELSNNTYSVRRHLYHFYQFSARKSSKPKIFNVFGIKKKVLNCSQMWISLWKWNTLNCLPPTTTIFTLCAYFKTFVTDFTTFWCSMKKKTLSQTLFERNLWQIFVSANISYFCTAWKVSVFGVILVRIFVHSHWFRIQSECGKRQTKITPNTDTFHAVQKF